MQTEERQIQQLQGNIKDALNDIPYVFEEYGKQSPTDYLKVSEYLKNPSIIEIMSTYPDGGSYSQRVALSLRNIYENAFGAGLAYVGIDEEIRGCVTIDNLLEGAIDVGDIKKSFSYLGRLSDILNSTNPPQKSTIFDYQNTSSFSRDEDF